MKKFVMLPLMYILCRLQNDLHCFVHQLLDIFKAWLQKNLRNLQNNVSVEESFTGGSF